ncbi:MAG: hypothetical protein GY909_15915 [Oligoflexia bacterium]|nr:hypothetical protein [Oligoflexia bacterium]
MRAIIVTFLLITNTWAINVLDFEYTGSLSEGLNPVDNTPLPTSDWEIRKSGFFEGNCNEFSDHIYYLDETSESFTEYLDESSLDCSSASHVDDTDLELNWVDIGIVQETTFSDEVLNCDATLDNCDINLNYTIEDQVYSVIVPTKGENATSKGIFQAFIYDTYNQSTVTTDGLPGIGGVNDLPTYNYETRYCIQKNDKVSDGANSVFAKTPLVNFIEYQWIPIRSEPSSSNGEEAQYRNEKSYIIKGLDSTLRSIINEDQVRSGRDY